MIIDRFNNFMKNIEIYFKIIEKNLLNYNINNINYNTLQNINFDCNEINFIFKNDEDLESIREDKKYDEFLPRILKVYNEMNKNEIDLVYNIPNNEKKIKIFGSKFVDNNKYLCKIIHNNKEYDLSEYFSCQDEKENILRIKLKGINNINDLECMFERCSQLSPLSDFSNWDTTYVFGMGNLFKDCKFFKLPDISRWSTNNVIIMNSMFNGCSSLKSLPDISNWNTSNVGSMRNMFSGCSSLNSLPDISKWDITSALKFKDLGEKPRMFDGCPDSLNIPEKFKPLNIIPRNYGYFREIDHL